MGTSSSYAGPTGKSPLLPPWAPEPPSPEPPPDDTGALPFPADDAGATGLVVTSPLSSAVLRLPALSLPTVSWQLPKAALSRIARAAAGASLATVARGYVRAHGTPRTAAAAALQGRATTARLGGFLASGVNNGFAQAAVEIGLQPYLGQDAEYVLAGFIDLLAPDGALLEDAAARAALIETSVELFERYAVADGGIAALDAMDVDGMCEMVSLSVTNYVNARLQEELIVRVERGTLPEAEANALMDQLKEFIASVVAFDLRDKDVLAMDWEGTDGQAFVDSLFEAGYELLGGAQ